MISKIDCQLCHRPFRRITNTHLWKEHQITMEDYANQFPDAPIDADGLAYSRVNHLRGKSYEEVYGEDKGGQLKKQRVDDAHIQFSDVRQRKIRSDKGRGRIVTTEQKIKISDSHIEHGGDSYRQRILRKLEYIGLECKRCGKSTPDPKDFLIHHKNLLNIRTPLGDHDDENLEVLCRSCHAKLHNELSNIQGRFGGISSIEKGMHLILKGLHDELGLDLNDINFKDTPKRVARAYYEIFEGVKNTRQQVEEILSTAFPSEGYETLIFCPDIKAFSMCPHHFLPVEYDVTIGYIPSVKGQVLGASKLPRLVELLAKRPVLQEVFTTDLANYLNELSPIGVAIVVSGVHFCMRMRGVKKMTSFETSAMRGVFMDKPEARKEFFDLLMLAKKR